jgi:hypothetical protein
MRILTFFRKLFLKCKFETFIDFVLELFNAKIPLTDLMLLRINNYKQLICAKSGASNRMMSVVSDLKNVEDYFCDYRYGLQGQGKDDEIKGEGNSVNFEFRMHDPRIGRFFAVDPLTAKYPHYTPYSFSGNKVIHCIELEGAEELAVNMATPGSVYYNANNKTVPETILFIDVDVNNNAIFIYRKILESERRLLDPYRNRSNSINQNDQSCYRETSFNGDQMYFRGTSQMTPSGANLPGRFASGGFTWRPNAINSDAVGNCTGSLVQVFNMPMTNGASFATVDLSSDNPAMVFNVLDNLGNIYYSGPAATAINFAVVGGATNFVITCTGATLNDTYNVNISTSGPITSVQNTNPTNTVTGNTTVTSTGITIGPVPVSSCTQTSGDSNKAVNDNKDGDRYILK